MNYKRNAKYFSPRPSFRPILLCVLIGGAILALALDAKPWNPADAWNRGRYGGSSVGFDDGRARRVRLVNPLDGRLAEPQLRGLQGAGAFLLFVAIGLFLRRIGWPGDRTIDQVAEEVFAGIRSRALAKLCVEPEEVDKAEAIEHWSFQIPPSSTVDANGKRLVPMVQGRDGLWRSTVVEAFGLYFSETAVHCYRQTRSIVSPNAREDTNEFWYRDIVSVKVASSEVPATDRKGRPVKGKTVHYDTLSLRNSGGEVFECTVRDRADAERAVVGMRSLLREVKNIQ